MKTGIANLPLHYGKAPRWLFTKMTDLSRQICIAIVEEFGQDRLLENLSDPFWFQSFGCVLGFDWHSSGLTTTVCGAIKEGLRGLEKDLGVFVAGGKGATSRKTPEQIRNVAYRFNLDSQKLIYASRMSAKVDNTALQDGFQLYHHTFFFTNSGNWSVVQQGMNINSRWARRYHWLKSAVSDFVCEPQKAICCDYRTLALNMVAKDSSHAREASCEASKQRPASIIKELKTLQTLNLPSYHQVFLKDLRLGSLNKILIKTYEKQPDNFERLLGIQGVGPKTIRALALISELIYGAKPSFRDPVKFSFAHGGKDGHPYRINRQQYSKSIEILKKTIQGAKIERSQKLQALHRLYNS